MTDTTTEHREPGQPLGLALTDQLGHAPWADDVEAWLEASSAEEIADDIDRYTMAEVARAVVAERERLRAAVEAYFDAPARSYMQTTEQCDAQAAMWRAFDGPNAEVTGRL